MNKQIDFFKFWTALQKLKMKIKFSYINTRDQNLKPDRNIQDICIMNFLKNIILPLRNKIKYL